MQKDIFITEFLHNKKCLNRRYVFYCRKLYSQSEETKLDNENYFIIKIIINLINLLIALILVSYFTDVDF